MADRRSKLRKDGPSEINIDSINTEEDVNMTTFGDNTKDDLIGRDPRINDI